MKKNVEDIKVSQEEQRFQSQSSKEMEESLQKIGMLHPLIVNQEGEIICGRRRWQAAQSLGWKEVPVQEMNIQNELEKLDTQLMENGNRRDLSPMEWADLLWQRKKLWRDKYGDSLPDARFYEETEKLLGRSQSWIYSIMQLFGLDKELQEKVQQGEISYRVALKLQSSRPASNYTPPSIAKMKLKGSGLLPFLSNKNLMERYSRWYNSSPNLFQIFTVMNFLKSKMKDAGDLSLEYHRIDPELIHNFITLYLDLLPQLESINQSLLETQERIMEDPKESK